MRYSCNLILIMLGVLIFCGWLVLISLVLCEFYLFNYLIVLENFNVLLLIVVLLSSLEESRLLFVSMMALFVLEISVMLIVVGLSLCGDSLRFVVGL